MSVENECGREVDSGIVVVELSEMRVGITQGHYSGPYTVKYSAVGVGGVTGTTTGAFSFTVAEGHPCDGKGDGHKNHNERENNGHEHGKEKEEHGHEQVKEHGDDHSGHDGHSEDDSSAHVDHGTMGHVSTHGDHPSASGDHASHETRPGEHGEHTEHEGDEDGHQDHGARGGTLASGPLPELPADGRAALLALVLCAGLGVVGGVFLRSAD
jgi:hypothetical protein